MEETRKVRICVPVCVENASEIEPAINRSAEIVDVIEIRMDCLLPAEVDKAERILARLCAKSSRPLIITFRPAEQGGKRELDDSVRVNFWRRQEKLLEHANLYYGDIELAVIEALSRSGNFFQSQHGWERIICSHHDFIGVPAELEKIYQRMIATRARVLKIAFQANEITDCIPALNLLERARVEGHEMIAIAMGDSGILTRILGPSRGSVLTYGFLDEINATAPGQISALELRDLYRIRNINGETQIMGLVGEHVMHSVSPHIHNDAFAARNQNAVYIPLKVKTLGEFVRRMVHPRTREIDWNLRGLSITAPHKIAIMRHLDWIDPTAVEVGAVNTVVVSDNILRGYNTDASSALAPLDGLIELKDANVAVIGAGGAARSLLWSLRKVGAHVTVFARDEERATLVARQFGTKCELLADASFSGFEIVINTSPLGTRGVSENASPVTTKQLEGVRIVYDLVYNPIETRLMREASEAGCHSVGGLKMLVAQAAEQFKIWTGTDGPVDVMHDSAFRALTKP